MLKSMSSSVLLESFLPLCPQLNSKEMTTNTFFAPSCQPTGLYNMCILGLNVTLCSLWDPGIRKIVSQYVSLPSSSHASFIPSASVSPPFPPLLSLLESWIAFKQHTYFGRRLASPLSPCTVSTFCCFSVLFFCLFFAPLLFFETTPGISRQTEGGGELTEAFERFIFASM